MGLERREKQSNLYNQLQKEILTLLQQLCGDQWSDFNAHDPGVTLAEIINYALYELDYQLTFSPGDICTDSRQPDFRSTYRRNAGHAYADYSGRL